MIPQNNFWFNLWGDLSKLGQKITKIRFWKSIFNFRNFFNHPKEDFHLKTLDNMGITFINKTSIFVNSYSTHLQSKWIWHPHSFFSKNLHSDGFANNWGHANLPVQQILLEHSLACPQQQYFLVGWVQKWNSKYVSYQLPRQFCQT